MIVANASNYAVGSIHILSEAKKYEFNKFPQNSLYLPQKFLYYKLIERTPGDSLKNHIMSCPCCQQKTSGELIRCSLCQKEAFCSEKCQQVGWSLHQDGCKNIHVISNPSTTLFTQEVAAGIDLEDPRDPANQSHLLKFVSPKQTIDFHLIEGTAKFSQTGAIVFTGGKPSKELGKKMFRLNINGVETPNYIVKERAIYKGAKGIPGQLAGSLRAQDESKLTLWVDKLSQKVSAMDEISVSLIIDGVQRANIMGKLVFPKSKWWSGKSRLLPERGIKFKNVKANIVVLRGRDRQGNSVKLSFSVDLGKIRSIYLVDVEFSTPLIALEAPMGDRIRANLAKFGESHGQNVELPAATSTFRCDPKSLEHVTALTMALQEKIPDHPMFNIINTHRMAMEEALNDQRSPPEPSLKINAAVQSATNDLWAHIDALQSQTRYKKTLEKLVRAGASGPKLAGQMADELVAKMSGLRAKTGKGLKKGINSAQKGVVRGQIEDLEKAIRNVQDQPLDSAVKAEYNAVLDKLRNIMDPTQQ